jgi:glycine/D-amino acid oxidase-like deaminating enzyme
MELPIQIQLRRCVMGSVECIDGGPRSALIGEVARDVYVAGGRGVWGLAPGPVTGRLLAEQITTRKQPEALREFDPLRRTGR